MQALSVRRAEAGDFETCLRIRDIVFVQGQNVPIELERDGLDDQCRHYIAELRGRAVGTARVKPLDGAAKIQRVAVLSEMRGQKVGQAIMAAILDDLAADPEIVQAVLDSQASAIGFYEALGFVAVGPEFLDAGIPHRHMRIQVG